jgi:hypothetical protein
MRCNQMKRLPYKNKKDRSKERSFRCGFKDEQQGEGGTLLSVARYVTTT